MLIASEGVEPTTPPPTKIFILCNRIKREGEKSRENTRIFTFEHSPQSPLPQNHFYQYLKVLKSFLSIYQHFSAPQWRPDKRHHQYSSPPQHEQNMPQPTVLQFTALVALLILVQLTTSRGARRTPRNHLVHGIAPCTTGSCSLPHPSGDSSFGSAK